MPRVQKLVFGMVERVEVEVQEALVLAEDAGFAPEIGLRCSFAAGARLVDTMAYRPKIHCPLHRAVPDAHSLDASRTVMKSYMKRLSLTH